jgi:hypothetical protein
MMRMDGPMIVSTSAESSISNLGKPGTNMKKLNLFELYKFGQMMRFFDKLTPQTRFYDINQDCRLASGWFDWLLKHDHIPIADSRADASSLKAICDQIASAETNEVLGEKKDEIIRYYFSRFESVLSAELARLNIYFVTSVGGYDTGKLLSSGKVLFPDSTVKWMSSEAVKSFEEGTRCLALKLATAGGFQLLRAVEAVMHQYYDVVSRGAKRPESRNMGQYIAAMEKIAGIDQRMLEVLRGIKNLRRNPLAHPEDFLEMEDALIILDIAKSSISTMAQLAREHSERKTN